MSSATTYISTSTNINSSNWLISNSTATTASTTDNFYFDNNIVPNVPAPSLRDVLLSQGMGAHIWPDGTPGEIILPDKSEIRVDRQGNYRIVDKDAKVTYKANRIREFNRYLNASDLLEEFIRDAGKFGVRQSEILEGLFGAFIHWLILKAAEKDSDPIPDGVQAIEHHPALQQPHCQQCGKFVTRNWLPFCDRNHMLEFANK